MLVLAGSHPDDQEVGEDERAAVLRPDGVDGCVGEMGAGLAVLAVKDICARLR